METGGELSVYTHGHGVSWANCCFLRIEELKKKRDSPTPPSYPKSVPTQTPSFKKKTGIPTKNTLPEEGLGLFALWFSFHNMALLFKDLLHAQEMNQCILLDWEPKEIFA